MNAVTQTAETRAQAAQRIICEKPLTLISSAGALSLIERADSDREFCHDLSRECAIVLAASEPATSVEIGVMLHRLSLHYPDRKLNPKEAALVAADWLADLDGVPFDLIETGFRRWRTGPKCAFFPKPGEILALTDYERRMRKALAKRADEITEALAMEGANASVSQ